MAVMNKSANDIDRHIGGRVRMRRMMLSMSQETLASKLGLTFQQVQKYEKGVNRIGGSRMVQISNALGAPPAFFFESVPMLKPELRMTGQQGADLSGDSKIVTEFFSISDATALATAFVKIEEPSDRRLIVGVAKALARSS